MEAVIGAVLPMWLRTCAGMARADGVKTVKLIGNSAPALESSCEYCVVVA